MIAVYGGTFDPVHKGHLHLITQTLHWLNPDRLLLLPCYQPVHKTQAHATPEQRLDMLRLAVGEHIGLSGSPVEIDTRELKAAEPRFTWQSMTELHRESGDIPLCFVIGADSLNQFTRWKNWRRILELCNLLVFSRPGIALAPDSELQLVPLTKPLAGQPSRVSGIIWVVENAGVQISSTALRNDIGGHKNYVSDQVNDYIQSNHLYNTRT